MARMMTIPGPVQAAATAVPAPAGQSDSGQADAGMTLLERLPGMADDALGTLGTNAERLATSGTAKRQKEAQAMLPAIQAEIAARRARKAAEAPRRSAAGRKPAKAKNA